MIFKYVDILSIWTCTCISFHGKGGFGSVINVKILKRKLCEMNVDLMQSQTFYLLVGKIFKIFFLSCLKIS